MADLATYPLWFKNGLVPTGYQLPSADTHKESYPYVYAFITGPKITIDELSRL